MLKDLFDGLLIILGGFLFGAVLLTIVYIFGTLFATIIPHDGTRIALYVIGVFFLALIIISGSRTR